MALTTEEEHPQATKRQQRDQHFSHRRLARKSRRARRQARRAVAAAQFELELRSMALCVTDTCDAAPSTFANQHRKRRNRSSNGSSIAGLGPTVRLSRRLVTGVRWSRRAALILPPMVRAAFPQACLLVGNKNNCGSSARSRCKGLHRAMERLSQHLPQTFTATDLRPARAKRVPRRMWFVVPDNGITTTPEVIAADVARRARASARIDARRDRRRVRCAHRQAVSALQDTTKQPLDFKTELPSALDFHDLPVGLLPFCPRIGGKALVPAWVLKPPARARMPLWSRVPASSPQIPWSFIPSSTPTTKPLAPTVVTLLGHNPSASRWKVKVQRTGLVCRVRSCHLAMADDIAPTTIKPRTADSAPRSHDRKYLRMELALLKRFAIMSRAVHIGQQEALRHKWALINDRVQANLDAARLAFQEALPVGLLENAHLMELVPGTLAVLRDLSGDAAALNGHVVELLDLVDFALWNVQLLETADRFVVRGIHLRALPSEASGGGDRAKEPDANAGAKRSRRSTAGQNLHREKVRSRKNDQSSVNNA